MELHGTDALATFEAHMQETHGKAARVVRSSLFVKNKGGKYVEGVAQPL